MSFKRHFQCGNVSLLSDATAVQSRPKSHTFTVNFAVFAPTTPPPPAKMEGSISKSKSFNKKYEILEIAYKLPLLTWSFI